MPIDQSLQIVPDSASWLTALRMLVAILLLLLEDYRRSPSLVAARLGKSLIPEDFHCCLGSYAGQNLDVDQLMKIAGELALVACWVHSRIMSVNVPVRRTLLADSWPEMNGTSQKIVLSMLSRGVMAVSCVQHRDCHSIQVSLRCACLYQQSDSLMSLLASLVVAV